MEEGGGESCFTYKVSPSNLQGERVENQDLFPVCTDLGGQAVIRRGEDGNLEASPSFLWKAERVRKGNISVEVTLDLEHGRGGDLQREEPEHTAWMWVRGLAAGRIRPVCREGGFSVLGRGAPSERGPVPPHPQVLLQCLD